MAFIKKTLRNMPSSGFVKISVSKSWFRPLVLTSLIMVIFVGILGGETIANSAENASPITDHQIILAIEERLASDPSIAEQDVDVMAEEGIVTFLGSVGNLFAKERLTEYAGTIKGVRTVINRVSVKPYPFLDDEHVQENVEHALQENPATELFDIVVYIQKGYVTLKGTVASWQEKQLAIRVAKQVKGVRGVKSELQVKRIEGRIDSDIRSEIIQRIKFDAWLSDRPIQVDVDDGVVSLTGRVNSVAEKTRAATLAWVPGVSEIENDGLRVQWGDRNPWRRAGHVALSDESIRKAILDAIAYDPRITSTKIRPEIRNGVVTLTGTVRSLRAKRAVKDIAHNTIGVIRVVNWLKVRPQSPWEDATIENLVKAALARTPTLDPQNIEIRVEDGIVYLWGTVHTDYEKTRADSLAAQVKGVKKVINQLHAPVAWNWKSDWEIREAIHQEFWWSPFLQKESIHVQVEHGIATLTGRVNSWGQRQIAQDMAYEGGARFVDNQLRVRSFQ